MKNKKLTVVHSINTAIPHEVQTSPNIGLRKQDNRV